MNNNLNSMKEHFMMVFSNDGHYQWTNDYKKQYLFAIKECLDNNAKDLSESIISKTAEEIYAIVIKYDTDLNLFKNFSKDYELYSKKTIELYNIDFSENDIENLEKLSSKEYSFDVFEKWENVGIIKDNGKVSYVYAQNSYETSSTKIEPMSFDPTLWNQIEKIANRKTKLSYGKLSYINAKVVSPKRRVLKLTFDIKRKLFSVSYDKTEVDENGKKIDIADSNRSALNCIIPTLPITDISKQNMEFCLTQGRDSVISEKVLNKISFHADDDILIIPTIQSIKLENAQTAEHSEKITSEMYNQRSAEIEKAARTEYENYGTLKSFFINNPKHNTKNNQIKKIANINTNNLERLSFHAYIVVVRDANVTEKSLRDSGHLKNKVLNLLSVDFDYGNNEMTIRNSNYSGESQDAIIHKILELSKQ